MAKFYEFNQNNSGGSFSFDEKAGITHIVVIEANSVYEAKEIALEIGIYFNGIEDGYDCPCCGDRWSDYIDEDDGKDVPCNYDTPLEDDAISFKWMDEGKEACVHYLDGRKEWY